MAPIVSSVFSTISASVPCQTSALSFIWVRNRTMAHVLWECNRTLAPRIPFPYSLAVTRPSVAGRGGPRDSLQPADLRAILGDALAGVPAGARVLAVVPDRTRDDNTHLLVPLASALIRERGAARFDVLIAQGTHPAMT